MAAIAGTALQPIGEDYAAINAAYHTFWSHIVSLTGERARPIGAKAFTVKQIPGKNLIHAGNPKMGGAFEFKGMSSRSGRSGADYDIYVQVDQDIRVVLGPNGERRYEAEKSTTCVLYLEFRTDQELARERTDDNYLARCFSGFHYDLAFGHPHHPLFHAQLAFDCIPGAAVRRRYLVPPKTHKADAPRVPTPPMDLAGVCYLILHDHYGAPVKKGWPAEVAAAAARLPALPCGALSEGVLASNDVACHHWYLHSGHHA